MKILSFGHIPTWAGGRQSSGLANVMYQLAKNMADCIGVELTFAATDIKELAIKRNALTIMGWTPKTLLRFSLLHPCLSMRSLWVAVYARVLYGKIISVPDFFFKGVHFSRCIKKVSPDIVHLHGIDACVYVRLVPSGVKAIVTMHGLIGEDETIQNHKCCMKMERAVCKSHRLAFIAFIAKQLIDDFASLYGGITARAFYIPNAYDNRTFYYEEPLSHSTLTLVTIASLSRNKGQHRVIEAIAKAGIECRYICIGSGTEERIYNNQTLANRLGVDYEYVGMKSPDEIRESLRGADYMILPSSTEGFGLVFLESIACGVPVVLPKHLPIVNEKDLIIPGINAVLIDSSEVDVIAETLGSLPRLQFNHKAVSESISGYTWEDVAGKYVKLIREIL